MDKSLLIQIFPMTKAPSIEDVADVVRPYLRLLPSNEALSSTLNLGSVGLDSMASIDLLLDLERHFGISISDDALTENSFSNLEEIQRLVVASMEE